MKTKFIGSMIITLSVGIVLGVLLQKYYTVGNLLSSVGVNYRSTPTPAPTLTPTPIPTLATNAPGGLEGRLSLFILAGQSNISGRGDLPTGQTIKPRILVFGNDYHWRLATEPIDDPTGQVDTISEDIGVGFSPAVPFATALLARQPDLAIGLIPCAVHDSSIDDWRRNLDDRSLYGSCLKRARAASTMGQVAGILFFQGETDANDPNQSPLRPLYASQWSDKFSTLVSDWRKDLQSPELPIVFAQIGTNGMPDRFPNWDLVKAQQRSVKLPFCAMITTDDLPLQDELHFTTPGYEIIGQRFAQAMGDLMQAPENK